MVKLIRMRWWHIPAISTLEDELFGDEAWTPELFWSELANADSRYYLVALSAGDGPPLGYGGLAAEGTDAYVQTIGVATQAQRAGIGRQILQALLDEADQRGAHTCWLEVRTDNVVAQQLYRRFGFIERGLRRGYYQPSGADALVMAVPLAARSERLG